MNMTNVNETYDHAVHDKIKVLHYFRFAAYFSYLFQFHIN